MISLREMDPEQPLLDPKGESRDGGIVDAANQEETESGVAALFQPHASRKASPSGGPLGIRRAGQSDTARSALQAFCSSKRHDRRTICCPGSPTSA
jgi:hypothetical protein